MLKPEISRLPVLPYEKMENIPEGYPDPIKLAERSKVHFDTDLSKKRYYVVQSLFDQTITFRHKELQQATKAILDAEKKLGDNASDKAKALLDEAKKLAWSPLITADQTHFSGQVKLKTGQAVALALPPSQIRLLPTSTTRIA